MNRFLHLICVLVAVAVASEFELSARPTGLNFCCSPQNDLFIVARQSGLQCQRFEAVSQAIEQAPAGTAVLILADGYPDRFTQVDKADLERARSRDLRLFIEYPAPATFPELELGKPQEAVWERGVVAGKVFGEALPGLKILAIHGAHFQPSKATNPWLVVARVAGFDTAVYGLPKNAVPLLFELPGRRIIVATSKLSGFVTGRYAPARDWEIVLEKLLSTLDPTHAPFELRWSSVVAPAYTAQAKLPRGFERKAFQSAATWILESRLLVPAARTNEIATLLRANTETTGLPDKDLPADGSFGILEGYASGIRWDGSQVQRLPLRADCHAESAMLLAFDKSLNRAKHSGEVAANLLDFVYFKSGMCAGPRADEKHAAFGQIGWGDISPAWLVANYGDDEARVMLGTMAAAASLEDTKWNEALVKGLLSNFRTTGKLGFRGDRVDVPSLAQNGWKHFYQAETVNYSPHFESFLWACNLWAYRATQYRPFLDRTKNAIAMTMKVYPTGWRWQDNSERSRMLLCLAWLTRIEDTPEHREWIRLVAGDLLKRQQPNGAIHEWLGGTGGGHYQIPQSNETYGTGETPLIQQNGDPASDQLYTTGFALLGLHEAAAATGDKTLKQAEDKLAEFLCRIQTRSEKVPYLNGWWFRTFDDRRWEFWASSADIGWGAWSLETGWAQAWTAATLAMREKKTTFWDLTSRVRIEKEFNYWRPRMLE
jgi:hypothetical protein